MGETKHICFEDKNSIELVKMMQARKGIIVGHRQKRLESRGQVERLDSGGSRAPHVLSKKTESEGRMQISW